MRDLLLFGPVLVLWSLGFWVALRSGLDTEPRDGWRPRLVKNASRLFVRLLACLLVLLILLQLVGYRLAMSG